MASRHCGILIHDVTIQGNNLGASECWPEKNGTVTQNGANRNKPAQFLCRHKRVKKIIVD